MEAGPRWTETLVVHDPWTKLTGFSVKKKSKIQLFLEFCREAPPVSLKSSCSPQKIQEDPWFLKIIPDIALATSRNYK
jgi:hypothetical protein